MRITHSHAIDNSEYSNGIANAEFSVELSDGINLSLKAIDIKNLHENGLDLPVDVDEWISIARKSIESNRDLRIFYLMRDAFEKNMNNGIYYDQDYLRFSIMGSGKQAKEDIEHFHKTIMPNFVEAMCTVQSSLYYLNPTELENINNKNSKWIMKIDGLYYEDELLSLKLSNQLKDELFTEFRQYFTQYYAPTLEGIGYALTAAEDRPTFEFILRTGGKLIQEFSAKRNATICDVRALIVAFFGEYAVDDTFD